MDSSRLRTGELVAGIGGAALFLFLFFDWFGGGVEVTGSVLSGNAKVEEAGISGWNALSDLPGFLIMLSGVAGLTLAYLAASGQRFNGPLQRGMVTFMLGDLAVLLVLWRMVAGTPSLKIGVFLGLAAVITIAVGALMALREDGWEPLVSVPGGRTRAAAATAPTTTAPAVPPPAAPPASKKAPASKKPAAKKRAAKKRAAKKPAARR